jgi:Peptidase MA superfamily
LSLRRIFVFIDIYLRGKMDYRQFLYNMASILQVVALLFIRPLYAQDLSTIQKNGVNILFDEHIRPAAEEAVELYPFIKRDLEKIMLWEVNFMPTVILIKDSKAFQMMAGNDLIVAYAVPYRDLMVIDYARIKAEPFSLESIMRHELCHLLLHKYIKDQNLPVWLDEGVAQWVSGGLADIIMDSYSVLDDAILSNRLIRLKYIEKGFPDDGRRLTLAYAESKSLIDYIISDYGRDGFLRLLDYLKDGEGINSAVQKAYAISFDELEKGWYDRLKKRATILTFLINNLYEILFFLSALLLIYGFIRVIIKKRSREEYEDEDEGNELN